MKGIGSALLHLKSAREKVMRFTLKADSVVELVERHRGAESLALAGPLAQLGDTLAKMRDFHGAVEPLERLDALLGMMPKGAAPRTATEDAAI